MITIDSTAYNVPVLGIDRKVEPLHKSAERDENGTMHLELIGIFINYSIQFGSGATPDDYAALWDKLTEATEFHTFEIPDGDGFVVFDGYLAPFSDKMRRYQDPQAFYKSLSISIIAKSPTNTP